MITFVEGIVEELLPTMIVLNVGGIGYQILIPTSSFEKIPPLGNRLKLLTHYHVREDAQLLYGFFSNEERDLFRLLVTHVSGVGPKLALAILSGMSVGQFKGAVVSSDIIALARISGVGKKTAQRVVLELKDKLGVAAQWEAATGSASDAPLKKELSDAVMALMALGYKQQEASKAAQKVMEESSSPLSREEIIKRTLQQLS